MASFGVFSGVMCPLRDNHGNLAAMSLSSGVAVIDDFRRMTIGRHMGDMLMFQRYFHELFVAGVLNEVIPPFLEGVKLSGRERECLALAARGFTSDDIGVKLGIKPRTVQNHFDTIRSKLGAANRQEAIYLASKLGYIAR